MSVGAVNKQTGERIPTAGMPPVDSVLSETSTNPVQNRVVKAALDDKADTDMVAADFNAGTSYTAGNYCVQDGKLYKFKNNHSGAWSASDVDEVKITGELSSLKSGLTTLRNDMLFGDLPSNGFNPLTQCTGIFCFSVFPDLALSQGVPTDFSAYGTVFGCSGTRYQLMVYIDVAGKFAIWSQSNVWVKYSSV